MHFFKQFVFYVEKKIKKNEEGLFLKILYFFSLFWKVFSWSKNFLYDHKILQPRKVSIKIISIGNITVGGTGKTPFVLEIAEKIMGKEPIAILSRGYRSSVEHQKIPFLVKPGKPNSWKEIGDEPAMIAERFFPFIQKKALFLFVGKHRTLSAEMAEKAHCKVALIDDGFSYRKLFRDEDILLINGKDPLGKNFFLPRGFLRESPKNLQRASLVVIHQVFTEQEFYQIKEKLQIFTNAPFVGMRPFVKNIIFSDKKERKIQKAALFCAIGSPDLFYEEMKKRLKIVDQLTQLDHEPFVFKKLQEFAIKAKNLGAEALLCTEKDFIKLSFDDPYEIPIGYVEMGLDIFVGKEHIENILKHINALSS